MKRLTKREEVIMDFFWKNGKMTVNAILAQLPEPKPHVNTVSTQVRHLEEAGFLAHEKKGMGYIYYPIISSEEYSKTFIGKLVSQCLEGSYINAVSALLKDDKISIDELKELINRIEQEG